MGTCCRLLLHFFSREGFFKTLVKHIVSAESRNDISLADLVLVNEIMSTSKNIIFLSI